MGARRIVAALIVALALPSLAVAEEQYRQPILYEWDRGRIDVWILPPGHGQIYNDGGALPAGATDLAPVANSYQRAMERGVQVWRTAINNAGPDWLKSAVSIRSYVAGRDMLPVDEAGRPEIIVAMGETMGPVLGTSFPSKPCPAVVNKLYHVSFTFNDVVNLTAHEVGHCLGLAHIDGPKPETDLMQAVYQHPDGLQSTPIHCPSTLNIAALEKVFARTTGSPTASIATVPASKYATAC